MGDVLVDDDDAVVVDREDEGVAELPERLQRPGQADGHRPRHPAGCVRRRGADPVGAVPHEPPAARLARPSAMTAAPAGHAAAAGSPHGTG